MMDAVVNRFIFLLKGRGVRISPAESLDAMQALTWIALHDRDTVRTVLCSTLIKDLHDLPIFEELFKEFFSLPKSPPQPSESAAEPLPQCETEPESSEPAVEQELRREPLDNDNAHEEALDIREYFDKEQLVTHFNSQQDFDNLSLAEFGQNLLLMRNQELLDQLMQKAAQLLTVRRVKNAGRAGELNFNEAIASLDTDVIADAVAELLDELSDTDIDEALIQRLSKQLNSGGMANLTERLKRYLERELALREPTQNLNGKPPGGTPDYHFSEHERKEMAEIVRRLYRRMRGSRSYRRQISHRGRISVPLTLRRNMKYEGIPFRPVVTRYRDEKSRLAVICDVSLSVRNTARFMLHLVYSLQSFFEQVKSFVFVSDLADASEYFEQLSIDEAIAAVFGGELLDADANSNYGRALEIFCQRHLGSLTHQTTVIILGDGRGNRNPPNAWALEEIRRRARQLIWLSPEPRGSWGLGSSDMPLYEPICHRAEVVRNLKQLGQVTEDLIRGTAMGSCHG